MMFSLKAVIAAVLDEEDFSRLSEEEIEGEVMKALTSPTVVSAIADEIVMGMPIQSGKAVRA
jgi:hypothetical protein